MPFYDNFLDRGQITAFGKKIIKSEIANRLELIDQFCDELHPKILEFGPGKGHFAQVVAQKQWEYIAVDGSPAIIKKLKSSGYNIINAFVPPLPISLPKDFDVVLMEHFIEHMASPGEARELISQTRSTLKNEGIIILIAPDYLSHKENFWNSDYTHSFVTSLERLKQLIVDGGCTVVYEGYETIGIQNRILVWMISTMTRMAYFLGIPQSLSLILTGSFSRSNKWKNVLLRSCVVVGKKE